MWLYEKKLEYPVNIKKKDLRMAKYIVTQYGGPYGELGAAIRYLNQRYTMPDDKGKALLTSIGTEELAHVEIICTMLTQLMKDASLSELEAAGLAGHYSEHGRAPFPTDAAGCPFTVSGMGSCGSALADLSEDMAAEAKAKATYEHLIDLATDEEVIKPLLFLRQREVIHFQRFKELYDEYRQKGYK